MPTYEYRCKSCGEHVEVVQSFKDDPLTTCPACGGSLRKVFGIVGIAFKGSGFYKTDSRPAAKSEQPGAAGRRPARGRRRSRHRRHRRSSASSSSSSPSSSSVVESSSSGSGHSGAAAAS